MTRRIQYLTQNVDLHLTPAISGKAKQKQRRRQKGKATGKPRETRGQRNVKTEGHANPSKSKNVRFVDACQGSCAEIYIYIFIFKVI